MTREIKFRAWDKVKKEIFDVGLIDFVEKVCFAKSYITWKTPPLYTEISIDGEERDFSDIELMQYTGLKDKNGKEIYEGDIIQRDGQMLSVHFGSSAFGVSVHRGDGIFASSWELLGGNETGKIIGNIYENPELLDNK